MEFEEKLAELAKMNKDRSEQLENNKNIWIQEVRDFPINNIPTFLFLRSVYALRWNKIGWIIFL